MTDGVSFEGGVIRIGPMSVNELMNYEMENGETFADQMLLIRANAAGDIVQQEDGSYVIKSADGIKNRIVGEPTDNGGRDITATNVQVGTGFDSGFDEGGFS